MKDGGSKLLQNVGIVHHYIASQCRRSWLWIETRRVQMKEIPMDSKNCWRWWCWALFLNTNVFVIMCLMKLSSYSIKTVLCSLYHCDMNHIELICAKVKGYIAMQTFSKIQRQMTAE
jgi:hypothetical protein